MTTKRIEYVQTQYPRNRSRFTSMWLVLLLTSSFLLIKPAPATMAQSGQAPDLSASPQAEAAAIIHRKAVIWRPEDKWKTSTGYNWSAIESELQDMRNAGITWARIFFKQNESTAFLDQLIPLAGQYNVTILIVTMKSDPGKDLGTPEQQATYRTWLTNLVNRYKGSVRYWEIENEENLSSDRNVDSGWHIDQTDGSDPVAYAAAVASYLEVLKQAYTTIKAIDPTLQVLIGGLCEWRAERYMDELIKQNGQQYFDIMSFHPFGTSPEAVMSRLDAIKAKMALQPALAAKPIWITAFGFHSEATWKSPGFVGSEDVKADYLLQTMELLSEASGVQGPMFWYVMSDIASNANGFSLVRRDQTQSPPPVIYLPAYTAMKDLWTTTFVRILPATEDSYVSRNNPGANYGNAQYLRSSYGSDVRQIYVKFDLSSLAGMTIQKSQLRFLLPNLTGAGSQATEIIQLESQTGWTEATLNSGNQPSPVIGTIASTSLPAWYQVGLHKPTLQSTLGNPITVSIDSTSADELVIQSRDWKTPPKLIVYYSPAATAAEAGPATMPEGDSEVMEAAPLDGDGAMIQDAYPWETGDRYAGMPYEQEMPKLDATPLPATNLYLPSLHQ